MVRKIIVLALLCLMNSCVAQEKTTNRRLLVYDNYIDKKELLPVSLNKYCLKNIVLNKKDTLKIDMPFSKGIVLDKEDELFHFLCKQDIISGWLQLKDEPDSIMTKDSGMIYAQISKEETIKETKAFTKSMKLIGRIKIAKDITSILIQTDIVFEENESIIKNIYLINIKNRKILSIVNIAHFSHDGFITIERYMTKQNKNTFIFYDDLISTDEIVPENETTIEEPLEKVVFMIDKNGKVLLLD